MRTRQSRLVAYEPLDEAAVRTLAHETGSPFIVTVYLNVDGRRYPAPDSFLSRLEALLDAARRMIRDAGYEDGDVDDDLAAVRRQCLSVDRSITRSLAVFSSSATGLLKAVSIPGDLEDAVAVVPWPDLGQLTEAVHRTDPWLAALTDGQTARLFHSSSGVVDEVTTVVDPVERQADTDVELGGWGHRRDEATRHHLKRVAQTLAAAADADVGAGVAVGGPPHIVEALSGLLPPALAARVSDHLSLPVDAGERDVTLSLQAAGDERHRRGSRVAVQRARDAVGSGRGVAGIDSVLQMLSDRRVEILVVERGYRAPGGRCERCGHLGTGMVVCPLCGGATIPFGDVVGGALCAALVQHAAVAHCEPDEISDLGHVAATLRY